MLCKKVMAPRKKVQGKNPVYLNVYDLTPINGYAYWLGLGVYHSGVQVHGVEYAFGAHDRPTTGIFEVEPRRCPGFTFRKSIYIGSTDMNPSEINWKVNPPLGKSTGSTGSTLEHTITNYAVIYLYSIYLLLAMVFLCTFIRSESLNEISKVDTAQSVHKLERVGFACIGFLCNCVLPPGLNETKIRQAPLDDRAPEGDRKKQMRSHSRRYDGSSNPHLSSGSAAKSSSQRHCLPPSSSLIKGSSTSSVTIK
ncbi:deSI-like protein [Senna tora]|uniref:DeSI-like protein n=1 Tax=Senna tora TaxID=362788 RepID=A0A834U180_9FABA|nr:deSI-like protein [Senna tora]